MDEVLEAIVAVRTQTSTREGAARAASLWDLFELDDTTQPGGSERGKVLARLSTRTQAKLVHWLNENEEEALRRYGRYHCADLYAIVRTHAGLATLPPGKPLVPEKRNPNLPPDIIEIGAYSRSGRSVDLADVIRLARLRRARRYFSERDCEEILGIPHPTINRMLKRMDEIGFSLERFTLDDLAYVARGPSKSKRGGI